MRPLPPPLALHDVKEYDTWLAQSRAEPITHWHWITEPDTYADAVAVQIEPGLWECILMPEARRWPTHVWELHSDVHLRVWRRMLRLKGYTVLLWPLPQ